MYKYFCPEGTSYDTDAATLANDCSLAPDVTFSVTSGSYSEEQSTDQGGRAEWPGVPTGQWSMSETIPEGYGDPVVYCRYTEWPEEATDVDDATFLVESPGGAWSGDFQYEGMRIVCGIFNIPGEGNTLTLYKWYCPEGLPYGDYSLEDFTSNCTEVHADVEFNGANNGLVVPMTTDASGQLEWTGIPTGPWGVTETIPEGYGNPYVFCRYVEWPEGVDLSDEWIPYSATDGFFVHEFDYVPTHLECYIFNIPFEQNWVDITKWWCSENVTIPYEQSADNLLEECERYTEGADFNLEYTGGSEAKTTDGEGNAEWSGAADGSVVDARDCPGGLWRSGRLVSLGRMAGRRRSHERAVQVPGAKWLVLERVRQAAVSASTATSSTSRPTIRGGSRSTSGTAPMASRSIPRAEYLRDNCDVVTTGVDFSLRVRRNVGSDDHR